METASPATRRGYARLVLLLGAGHLLAFVDRAKIAGAMPAIRRQIAMSDTVAGWVIGTGLALGYGVTILLLALSPRRGAARWSWRLPAGVALWSVAGASIALAPSAMALIATRILVGAGQALFIPAAVSWIVAEGDRVDARATGLSRFTAAASLGRSVGLLLVGLSLTVVAWAGSDGGDAWRWSFALLALPNLVLLALVRRRSAPSPASMTPADPGLPGAGAGLRAAYLALALLPIVTIQALAGWMPTLFVQTRGVTTQGAATWLGALTLVGGAGSQLLAGWLLQRMTAWRGSLPLVIVGGMALALPGLALFGWVPGMAAATLGVLAANLALGMASFAGILGWQQLIPAPARVAGNGLFLALVTIVGVGLGPLVAGGLTDGGYSLCAALMAVAMLCTVTAAALALVLQPHYRRAALA